MKMLEEEDILVLAGETLYILLIVLDVRKIPQFQKQI